MTNPLTAEQIAGIKAAKLLIWDESRMNHGYPAFAESAFGRYAIWEIDGDGYWKTESAHAGQPADGKGGGLNAAKAAAQDDFNTKVVATLNDVALRGLAPLPEGYALVPIEPTEAMWDAFFKARNEIFPAQKEKGSAAGTGWVGLPAVVWTAMLAASPAIPTARDGGDEAVAWMGYWPGAGTIAPNVTRTTHSKSIADGWVRDGAEITPLYARAALSNGAQP